MTRPPEIKDLEAEIEDRGARRVCLGARRRHRRGEHDRQLPRDASVHGRDHAASLPARAPLNGRRGVFMLCYRIF